MSSCADLAASSSDGGPGSADESGECSDAESLESLSQDASKIEATSPMEHLQKVLQSTFDNDSNTATEEVDPWRHFKSRHSAK